MDDGFSLTATICAVVIIAVAANAAFGYIATKRHAPIGTFVDVDGVQLHYIDRGPRDAIPLIIFHGNGALIEDMTLSGVVDAAAEHYRVICFDRPGFGHSSRPRLRLWTPDYQARFFAKAFKILDIERPLVLGHSWGTLIALSLAAQSTPRVRGVVLVSGYYFPTFRFDVFLASGPAVPLLGDLMRYTISPLVGFLLLPFLLKTIFRPCDVPTIFHQEFPKALLLRPGQLRAAAEETAFMVPAAAGLATIYNKIVLPVAIIAGKDDALIDSEQAVRLNAALPLSTMVRVPASGHMLHYEAPRDVVRAVQAVEAQTL
jgi:pimeloyl-ACP methyl ester carboxylesterase